MTAQNLVDVFARSLRAALQGEEPTEIVQYAARKKKNPDLGQPSLFETSNQPHLDDLGPGRWITIHSEKGEGGNKGGHRVYIGDDGKMKTGRFAGQTMNEAFGKSKQKRLAKRGSKHEHGQDSLFETESQPTLPGVGPKVHQDVDAIKGEKSESEESKAQLDKELGSETGKPEQTDLENKIDQLGSVREAAIEKQKQTPASKPDDREATAERIVDAINGDDDGYSAKAWIKDENVRIYVSRELSRGRKQDMGYIKIEKDGELNFNGLTRRSSAIAAFVTKALDDQPAESLKSTAKTPHDEALERSAKFRPYGKDHDRTIATRAGRLEEAMKKGHGPAMLDHLAGELNSSIDAHEERTKALAEREADDNETAEHNEWRNEQSAKNGDVAPGAMPEAKPGIVEAKPADNTAAKGGDQLGLFGEVANVKSDKAPALAPGGESKGKSQNLFDTGGNADQMDLFGDGVMPDDLVYKPDQEKKEKREAANKKALEAYYAGDAISTKGKGEVKAKSESVGSHESASQAHEKVIESGGTPREAAKAAQKQHNADYEFARASDIGNAGEDLKGSARHKVNAWKGLKEAEQSGTAESMMTRKNLLKIEPHGLHATIKPETSMSHLASHLALSAFPESPGQYPSRMKGEPPSSPEKLRQQYFDAYKSIKAVAEKSATDHVDPKQALSNISKEVLKQINTLQGLPPFASAMERVSAPDRYNPVANGLISMYNRSIGNGRKKTDFMNRVKEFANLSKEKLGGNPSKEHLEFMSQAAQDLMDGKSMNKVFGKEPKKVNRFNPAEVYVGKATRKGGRDLSEITSDPNKAVDHMVKTMGLRGVQWGNTVTDDERSHHAARATEALTDLADTLGIHPKDVALDGRLGLAIGARGNGNASAHYEPGSQVINLTRASGVGTLAHEWGHAFDHMLNDYGMTTRGSKQAGKYMSQDTDTHTITRPERGSESWSSTTSKPEHMKEMGYVVTPREKSDLRDRYRKWEEASKPFRNRLRTELQKMVNEKAMSAKKANDYWNSAHEIFARSFEQHVQHKLRESGKDNTYLAGLGGDGGGLWPTAEESKQMADAFDGIFEEYRKHKHGSPERIKFSASEAAAVADFWIDRYSTRSNPMHVAKPTEAQAKAGNYRMSHIDVQGLDITIETPKGRRRKPEWPPMGAHYGYVKRTKGKDGDHVDVFVGPNRLSDSVWIVNQVDQNGKFDEHKCLLGFNSKSEALAAYKASYSPGWKVGKIAETNIPWFKVWLSEGDTTEPLNKERYSISDPGDYLSLLTDLVPLEIVRYEWNAAAHPRFEKGTPDGRGGEFRPAGRGGSGNRSGGKLSQRLNLVVRAISPEAGGRPTVKAELVQPAKPQPKPQQQRPRTSRLRELPEKPETIKRGHPLHHSSLPPTVQKKLLDWNAKLFELARPTFMIPTDKRSEAEQAESGWAKVNKNAVRELLDEMNQLDVYAREEGIPLSDYVNANQMIPKNIAERLTGGSRFFDLEKIRDKVLNKPTKPEPKPEQSKPDQKQPNQSHVADFAKAEGADRKAMLKNPDIRESIERAMGLKPSRQKPAEPRPPGRIPESQKPSQPSPKSLIQPKDNKLNAAVNDAVGGNASAAQHFKTVALDAWKQMKDQADQHNEAYLGILDFFDKKKTDQRNIKTKDGGIRTIDARQPENRNPLLKSVRNGEDPSTIPRFDELVDFAKRTYPSAITFMAGESDTGSAEDGVYRLLRGGAIQPPAPHSDEVLDRASEMVGANFWESLNDPEHDDDSEVAAAMAGVGDEEEIPFSSRRDRTAALIRYWVKGELRSAV